MMVSMRFTRLAGLAGILAPVITLTLIFVSIAMSPWFSWHDNALSDMGVSTTPNPFNAALLIGGLLYLVFVIGFVQRHRAQSLLARIAGLLLAVGGIGLTLVAVLTEEAGRIHYAVAATYFLVTPLAYELFGIDWLKRGQKVPGILTIAAGLAAFVMIAFVPHKRIAVPEILAAMIIAAWTFSFGVQMLIEPENN
jgi:hypothetical membrane protein